MELPAAARQGGRKDRGAGSGVGRYQSGRQTPLTAEKVRDCAPEAMGRFFLSGKYLMGLLSLKSLKTMGVERPK